MHLHPVDLLIIAAYVASTVVVGFWISARREWKCCYHNGRACLEVMARAGAAPA